jgi:hypothetical protein
MASKPKPKKLIVEGEQDKRVIPYLMEANGIEWGNNREAAPVDIQAYGGDGFINETIISTELKASGLTALGLVIDADDNVQSRWDSVRNACDRIETIGNLPDRIPESGLICDTATEVKFGVWIMPDNQERGMLETFLAYLIPDRSDESLWQYAQKAVKEAENQGATFINAHLDKAHIYTWLAWQNPPGRQLHNAVAEKILDPKHPRSQTFVKWFRDLYDL